jgi:unsaturated rhamnogalacturonyl hydrolase
MRTTNSSKRTYKYRKIISCILLSQCIAMHVGAAQQELYTDTTSNPGYGLPKLEDIKSAIGRIKDFYVRSTDYRIVDIKSGTEIKDLSVPNPLAGNDVTKNGFTNWDYPNGVLYSALTAASELFQDTSYINYAIRNYDFIFDHLPYFQKQAQQFGPKSYGYGKMISMASLDHCGAIGAALIKVYDRKKDKRYRAWIDTIDSFISKKQYRLEDGTLSRHRPQPSSLWTDDMYMSVPFLAQMGKLTGNSKYWDDAVQQVLGMSQRLFIPEKGLYDHGWNANTTYDPRFYWSRANGWAVMAICELLDVLPENYKGRDQILEYLQKEIRSLAEYQDVSGLWHNLLDKNDSFLETSGSAMFVYGIAKGINKGWVHFTYGTVAITGWLALQKMILEDGRVQKACVGTTFTNDITYYYNRPTVDGATFGNAPTILAGVEMIKLLQNPHYEILNANNSYHFKLKSDPKPR